MAFRNRVVVVTGGSAGIGRAAVRAFAGTGAAVAVVARESPRLEATVNEIRNRGGRAVAVTADVADPDAVEVAASRIEAKLGAIDIWVNNAMASVFAPVSQLSAVEVRRVTEVTYLGAVHGTLAALRRMAPRNRGTIVQVGSTLAYRAIPLQAPYCAAKHALRAFSDSLRVELRHERSRVRVTQVHLPAVNTPQFDWARSKLAGRPRPLPPVFQPELAARAILYAARHAPRELKVGWPVVSTIWLNKFFPGTIDRYLSRAAYIGQEEPIAAPARRPDNLFQSANWKAAAHGRFDDEAEPGSVALQLRTSLPPAAMVAGIAGFVGVMAILKRLGDSVAP